MGLDPITLGIGGSLVGGLLQSDASNNATDAQAASAANANALQKYQYDTTRADNAPWRSAGQDALNRLMGLLNDGSITSKFAGQVQNEPGYAFGMQQGQQAINNSASARGGIGGAALQAGSKFAQDYAGTKYNDAFNRFQTERQNTLDPLYRIAGYGASANTSNQLAGSNFANNVGSNMVGVGNAQAANSMNQGNIWGNALNQGIAQWNRRTPGPVSADPYGGGYQYDSPYDLYPG